MNSSMIKAMADVASLVCNSTMGVMINDVGLG